MNRFSKLVSVATIALAAATGSALAADWEGANAGAFFGYDIDGFSSNFAGVQAGYNWDRGTLVYGVEGELGWSVSSGNSIYHVAGRVGTEITDNALLFGLVGYGGVSTGMTYWTAGVGTQLMLGDQVYVRAEYGYYDMIDAAMTGHALKLGVGMLF